MVNYRRDYSNGAIYFFTLTLYDRKAEYLTQYIDDLGYAFRHVRSKTYFKTHAITVLPDHLHTIWELPENDSDYSKRWRLIKTQFTQKLINRKLPIRQNNRGEYNLWQKRFWEHRIRNDEDFEKHVDYIHYNPVKHGYVSTPNKWPHSSIHRYINKGILSEDWGREVNGAFGEME